MNVKKLSFMHAAGIFLLAVIIMGANAMAQTPKYAMVVVGSNTADAESMHIAFGNTGERVYSTLMAKGYTAANILYLSWDFGTNPNVDALATKANIQWGLQTWLKSNLSNGIPNENVVIYFIDHGGTNVGGYFFVPYDYLVYGTELSPWVNSALTEWDNTTINHNFANIVFETCYSGNLIGPTISGLSGPQRIVVTSTDYFLQAYSWWAPPQEWYDNRPADSNGEAIFSYYFLRMILAGRDVQVAFNRAYNRTVFEVTRLATITGTNEQQNPMIDNMFGVGYW
jgi:hypothetical protein